MSKITPERGYVLVKLYKTDPNLLGGTKIYVPDTGKEEPQFAEILAIGEQGQLPNGPYRDKGNYEVGDYCYFGKWQGLLLVMKGGDQKLIKQEDIYAVVELDEDQINSLKENK